MAEQPVEAFLISNPFEERPIWIADQLLKRGVSVFAWRPGTTEADAFRWNKELYGVVCGEKGGTETAEDKKIREDLLKALNLTDAAVIAAI